MRVVRWNSPSHVCYPPLCWARMIYFGSFPEHSRPSMDCKAWKDIWGATWIDVEGEIFPSGPAITSDNIEALQVPDPHSKVIRDNLKADYEKIDRKENILVVTHSYLMYEKCFNILGPEEFLYMMAADEDSTNLLLDKIFDFEMGIAEEYVKFKPDNVDTSDDYGMQDRLTISPDMWRKYFKPRLKKLYDFYRSELGKDIIISHHSCGHVMPIVEDSIEIGLTILNPIQSLANNPTELAKIARNRLVLSGGIEAQRILPYGSPEDIRKEVFKKLDLYWHDGGYLPMAEKITGVPDSNRMIMREAIKEWSKLNVEK